MKNFYEEFKRPIVIIALLFVAFFLYTKLVGPIPFYVNSVNTNKTDLFSSNGEGKASAVPDSAMVSLGVTQQATTVSEAQNKANETADKIIESVKKLGISEKDIKTTNYSVNPNYGTSGGVEILTMPAPIRDNGEQRITSYTVTQNVEVKVKPVDKVNQVVDAGTKAGANLVGGVNFTFSDELQKSLENTARKEAVANAKIKAEALAKTAGIRLGKAINVIENSNQPRYSFMSSDMGKAEQEPATNITPGENEVVVNVIIYYETY